MLSLEMNKMTIVKQPRIAVIKIAIQSSIKCLIDPTRGKIDRIVCGQITIETQKRDRANRVRTCRRRIQGRLRSRPRRARPHCGMHQLYYFQSSKPDADPNLPNKANNCSRSLILYGGNEAYIVLMKICENFINI